MISINELSFPSIGKTITRAFSEELILEQWIVPARIEVKLYHGHSFGYVILPDKTIDTRGFVIPKRLFKY